MDFSVMNRSMNKLEDKDLDLCCRAGLDSSFDTHPDFKVWKIFHIQTVYQIFKFFFVNVASIFFILGCSIYSRSLRHYIDRRNNSNICK